MGLGQFKGTLALLTGLLFFGKTFYTPSLKNYGNGSKNSEAIWVCADQGKACCLCFESSLSTAETNVKPLPTWGLIIIIFLMQEAVICPQRGIYIIRINMCLLTTLFASTTNCELEVPIESTSAQCYGA